MRQTEAEKKLCGLLYNDGIHVISSFELNQLASLTYGELVCDEIFEVLHTTLFRYSDHSPLTLHKGLAVTKHVLVFGSEKCVNSGIGLQACVEELVKYNTVFLEQKRQGFGAMVQRIKGGGVDKGGPVRELAQQVDALLKDTNKLREIRQNSADPNSLVPIGNGKVAYLSDDVRLFLLKKRMQEQQTIRVKSNLAKPVGGFGSGCNTKSGQNVVGAAHGLDEMMKMAKKEKSKFSDSGPSRKYRAPEIVVASSKDYREDLQKQKDKEAKEAAARRAEAAVDPNVDLLDFGAPAPADAGAGAAQDDPFGENDLLGMGSTSPASDPATTSDLLGFNDAGQGNLLDTTSSSTMPSAQTGLNGIFDVTSSTTSAPSTDAINLLGPTASSSSDANVDFLGTSTTTSATNPTATSTVVHDPFAPTPEPEPEQRPSMMRRIFRRNRSKKQVEDSSSKEIKINAQDDAVAAIQITNNPLADSSSGLGELADAFGSTMMTMAGIDNPNPTIQVTSKDTNDSAGGLGSLGDMTSSFGSMGVSATSETNVMSLGSGLNAGHASTNMDSLGISTDPIKNSVMGSNEDRFAALDALDPANMGVATQSVLSATAAESRILGFDNKASTSDISPTGMASQSSLAVFQASQASLGGLQAFGEVGAGNTNTLSALGDDKMGGDSHAESFSGVMGGEIPTQPPIGIIGNQSFDQPSAGVAQVQLSSNTVGVSAIGGETQVQSSSGVIDRQSQLQSTYDNQVESIGAYTSTNGGIGSYSKFGSHETPGLDAPRLASNMSEDDDVQCDFGEMGGMMGSGLEPMGAAPAAPPPPLPPMPGAAPPPPPPTASALENDPSVPPPMPSDAPPVPPPMPSDAPPVPPPMPTDAPPVPPPMPSGAPPVPPPMPSDAPPVPPPMPSGAPPVPPPMPSDAPPIPPPMPSDAPPVPPPMPAAAPPPPPM